MSNPHNRIFVAGMHEGFRLANEKDMTPQKFKMLLDQQTTIARKIFEAVPIAESWTSNKIATALTRMGSTRVDMKTLEGCLASLKDSGLVKEPERGLWQQVQARETVKLPEIAEPTPVLTPAARRAALPTVNPEDAITANASIKLPEDEHANDAPKTPAESLGILATSLRLRANALLKMADEIDAEAVRFEDQISAALAKLERFNALRALLTEG